MVVAGGVGVGGTAAVRPCCRLLAAHLFPKCPLRHDQAADVLFPKCPHRGYRVAVVFPKCSFPHTDTSSSPRRAAPWVVRLAVAPPAGPAEVAAGGRSLLSDHAPANGTIAEGDDNAFERIFVQSLVAAVKPLIIERVETRGATGKGGRSGGGRGHEGGQGVVAVIVGGGKGGLDSAEESGGGVLQEPRGDGTLS